MSDKDKIADTALDAGYLSAAEAARYSGKTRQAVHSRAKSRGVDPKARRRARIARTLAEIGELLKKQD